MNHEIEMDWEVSPCGRDFPTKLGLPDEADIKVVKD
jgi:hypothetical protein